MARGPEGIKTRDTSSRTSSIISPKKESLLEQLE
jgi:hypothetical protein